LTPVSHIRVISINRKLDTVGSEPLLVLGDDYEGYYIKNNRLITPATDLISEVLCHFLLRAWNIITPDISLVTLEPETFTANYGPRHQKNYYDRLAFGSKHIPNAIDFMSVEGFKGKVDFRRYSKPIDFARIGLFDMWVDNEDRPPDLKNLMIVEKASKMEFVAIDHAFTFRSGAFNSLKDCRFWPTESNYCLQSSFFNKFRRFLRFPDRNWIEVERKNFYLSIEKSKAAFLHGIEQIPLNWGLTKEDQSTIYAYLFNELRNKAVFEEYIRLWVV
jgi:hypothetical protein